MLSTEKKSPNEPQIPPSQKTTQDIWDKVKKFNPWNKDLGIRTQLLSAILPAVLLSIFIVSFQSYGHLVCFELSWRHWDLDH